MSSGKELSEAQKRLVYWLSRPAEERWAEIQRLREVEYGYEAANAPVARVLTFAVRRQDDKS